MRGLDILHYTRLEHESRNCTLAILSIYYSRNYKTENLFATEIHKLHVCENQITILKKLKL